MFVFCSVPSFAFQFGESSVFYYFIFCECY